MSTRVEGRVAIRFYSYQDAGEVADDLHEALHHYFEDIEIVGLDLVQVTEVDGQ